MPSVSSPDHICKPCGADVATCTLTTAITCLPGYNLASGKCNKITTCPLWQYLQGMSSLNFYTLRRDGVGLELTLRFLSRHHLQVLRNWRCDVLRQRSYHVSPDSPPLWHDQQDLRRILPGWILCWFRWGRSAPISNYQLIPRV